jgi:hypothetical protein
VAGRGDGIRHAYLLLVDPTLPRAFPGSYRVGIDWQAGNGRCWSVPTVPSRIGSRLPDVPLPTLDVSYSPDAELTLSHRMTIVAGDAPVLLLTTEPLVFSLSEDLPYVPAELEAPPVVVITKEGTEVTPSGRERK